MGNQTTSQTQQQRCYRGKNLARSTDWIAAEFSNQNNPDSFYQYGVEEPTAVNLSSFTAESQGNTILINWRTTNEVDLLGFNIYRSRSLNDEGAILNDVLVPVKSLGGLVGNEYIYFDQTILAGESYYYWLEIVTLSGSDKLAPIAVTTFYTIYIPLLKP